MLRLEVEQQIVLFLDHRKLINNIYRDSVKEAAPSYALKPELFDFHAKPEQESSKLAEEAVNDSSGGGISPKRQTKSKRKRKAANVVTAADADELKHLETLCLKLQERLQAVCKFPTATPTTTTTLPRYWEEACDWSEVHLQCSNSLQHFSKWQRAGRNYLVPPNCSGYNCDVTQLPQLLPRLPHAQYELLVLDPPWRNKYVRRLKRVRQEFAYRMLDIEQLAALPIARLVHKQTLVAIWCTNSALLQRALVETLLPAWELVPLHTLKWLKLNTTGAPIGRFNVTGGKQPYEMLYLARHRASAEDFALGVRDVKLIASVPSIVHSHKPPLLPWLAHFLTPAPRCLEIFARTLCPQFTSIGLEVLKLMDERLYEEVLQEREGEAVKATTNT